MTPGSLSYAQAGVAVVSVANCVAGVSSQQGVQKCKFGTAGSLLGCRAGGRQHPNQRAGNRDSATACVNVVNFVGTVCLAAYTLAQIRMFRTFAGSM